MRCDFDWQKRSLVLSERGLDLARANEAFARFHLTRADERHSAAEPRFISVGAIDDVVVIIVWTVRNETRRIITMWKANEKERTAYVRERDRSG